MIQNEGVPGSDQSRIDESGKVNHPVSDREYRFVLRRSSREGFQDKT